MDKSNKYRSNAGDTIFGRRRRGKKDVLRYALWTMGWNGIGTKPFGATRAAHYPQEMEQCLRKSDSYSFFRLTAQRTRFTIPFLGDWSTSILPPILQTAFLLFFFSELCGTSPLVVHSLSKPHSAAILVHNSKAPSSFSHDPTSVRIRYWDQQLNTMSMY